MLICDVLKVRGNFSSPWFFCIKEKLVYSELRIFFEVNFYGFQPNRSVHLENSELHKSLSDYLKSILRLDLR